MVEECRARLQIVKLQFFSHLFSFRNVVCIGCFCMFDVGRKPLV